jgi:cytochrome c oxidase subunit II
MTTTHFRTALAAAALLAAGSASAGDPAPVVEISAKRFTFDPSEVHLRRGETATLRITSRDVTHGLFLQPLGIDATIAAGKATEVTVTPMEVGRFNAICDHFCGSGHGNMHLTIVVEDAPKEASR